MEISTATATAITVLMGLMTAVMTGRPAIAEWQNVADRWEQYHLTPLQREWFQNARGGFGHCCDVADGLPADDWERRQDLDGTTHYWAEYEGKWYKVPDGNVLLHQGNPVGVAVLWLTTAKDVVRCFVPGPEN